MSAPLLIIDPGTTRPELACVAWVAQEARELGHEVALCLPALPDQLTHAQESLGELLPSPPLSLEALEALPPSAPLAGLMILGSGASPGDPLAWQTRLKHWLKGWLSEAGQARPVVGFCYGHQLLAHLDGAEVVYLWDQEKRVKASGLRRVTLKDEVLGLSGALDLVVSHREGFAEPPPGWRSIAQETHINGARAVEAMRHERAFWWGFQAHPEAVEAFLLNNDVRCELPQPYDGHRLVRAFLSLISQA